MQPELCCSPHSLHLHQLHSNLSRGEHSEVDAEHQVSGTRSHVTGHHILFWISGSNYVPHNTSNGSLGCTNACRSGDETGLNWGGPLEGLILCKCWSGHTTAQPPVQTTLSSGNVLLFPDRTDVPSVESCDLKRGPGQFNWRVSCIESIRENSKLPVAFCGVLKEELWRQAFHFTVLFFLQILAVDMLMWVQQSLKNTGYIISGTTSKLTVKQLARQ